MLINLTDNEELRISYIIGDKIQNEIIRNCAYKILPNGDIYVRRQGKSIVKNCTYKNRFILAIGVTRKLDNVKEEIFNEN